MANFEAFRWNFSSSTNPEIGMSAVDVIVGAAVVPVVGVVVGVDNVEGGGGAGSKKIEL